MSDSITRWWPKSGCTISIASMDAAYAALRADYAQQSELVTSQGIRLMAAEEAEDKLSALRAAAGKVCEVHANGSIFELLEPMADLRALLTALERT